MKYFEPQKYYEKKEKNDKLNMIFKWKLNPSYMQFLFSIIKRKFSLLGNTQF